MKRSAVFLFFFYFAKRETHANQSEAQVQSYQNLLKSRWLEPQFKKQTKVNVHKIQLMLSVW